MVRLPVLRVLLSSGLAVLAGLPVFASNVERVASFEHSALLAAARSTAVGGTLRVEAVPLVVGGKESAQVLALERFEVFTPKARIVVHTDAGEKLLPVPANVYLRGTLAGDPSSRVMVSVLETGEIRGLVTAAGGYWLLGAEAGQSLLQARAIDSQRELEESDGGFRCELDSAGQEAFRSEAQALAGKRASRPASAKAGRGVFDHTAVIAIETDQEFLSLGAIGGNTTTATNYIADLVAYASIIYTEEVQTSWALGHVSLWTTTDPYAQTGACGLLELGRHWNINNTGVERTVAHFLSGKNTNAGIAWVGVLCRAPFSTSPSQLGTTCAAPVSGTGNYGGDYGFTAGVDANFNINSPSVVWDILAFTHEIGHNFNSPHTHCYQGLNGNAAEIDRCYGSQSGTGCYMGTTSLPSGCPGSGQGCGTIMSYCHLISPFNSNTSLNLGLGHPYGVAPERVPNRMRDHVEATAASNPSCLAPLNVDSIFADGFESGSTANWI